MLSRRKTGRSNCSRFPLEDSVLRENVVILDEVTVTQQKLKGVEEIDRTMFAVNDDIRNASSSGLDLLRYIPVDLLPLEDGL